MTFDKQSFFFFIYYYSSPVRPLAVVNRLYDYMYCDDNYYYTDDGDDDDDDYNGFLTSDVPACIGKIFASNLTTTVDSSARPPAGPSAESAKGLFKNSERRRSAPGPSDLLFPERIEIKNGNNCSRNGGIKKNVLLSLYVYRRARA